VTGITQSFNPGVAAGKAVQSESVSSRMVNPLEEPRWGERLASHGESSFFHSAEWARVLEATYRHRPAYLTVLKEDRLCGLLAAMEVASPLTGRRGVALPFTDACPPLSSEEAPVEDLLREMIRYGQGRGWKYFEARGVGAAEGRPASLRFCGHRLDLSGGKEALFNGLATEARTAIRKAQKAGVEVEVSGSEEAMRAYYGLHCLTRRRHGLPPQSYRFFENIARHALGAGRGEVVLARHGPRPIAGAVFFHYGKKAVYKYGASDKACQHLRGNNLVMWEAIQHYAGQGLKLFDFGRSAYSDEGLRRFKRNFGGQEYALEYIKFDFRSGRYVEDMDRVKGWYNIAFRCLPTPLARLAGTAIYRHLS